ncbi:hypothetical protein ACKWTF_014791 [Chironomus riparius]
MYTMYKVNILASFVEPYKDCLESWFLFLKFVDLLVPLIQLNKVNKTKVDDGSCGLELFLMVVKIVLHAWILRLSDKSFMDNSQAIALLFLTLYTSFYYTTVPIPTDTIISSFKSVWFYFITGTILIILALTPIPMQISYVVCYVCMCIFLAYYTMKESMHTIEIISNLDAQYNFDIKKVWDALVFLSMFLLLVTGDHPHRVLTTLGEIGVLTSASQLIIFCTHQVVIYFQH